MEKRVNKAGALMFKDRNDYHGEKKGEQCLWMVDLPKKDAFWVKERKRV